jgi:hypothetical protein
MREYVQSLIWRRMQFVQGGPSSSHFTRRRRQLSQPYRDFLCGFRGFDIYVAGKIDMGTGMVKWGKC